MFLKGFVYNGIHGLYVTPAESHFNLKEQYPVTAHAPNFDFRTGCREIKRCEESKRTLKNPFASRLAEFNTTPKLLRITDQWYIVLVKFRFGRNPSQGTKWDGSLFHGTFRVTNFKCLCSGGLERAVSDGENEQINFRRS